MKKSNLHALAPLLGILLFSVALWVLHRSLAQHNLHEVLAKLSAIPTGRLLAALGLTVVSYALLTGYDWLAFRYIEHPLPFPRIALAAFIGYSLSNSFGNVLITGGSVRYRIYSSWGLTTFDITRVVFFCSITFIIGMLTLGGIFFITEPMQLPPLLDFLPVRTLRPVGVLFLLIVIVYMLLAFKGRLFTLRGIAFELPSPRLALAQLSVSSIDMVASAAVLYCLLPAIPGFTFISFLGYFLTALIAGLISQVPGGLGVFESILMVSLSAYLPADTILGTLLAYRAVYYLIPLMLGIVLMFGQELREHAHRLRPVARILDRTVNMLVPNILAFLTFMAGAMLLFSGATPGQSHRLQVLYTLFPLYFLEVSHFLGSLAGMGLLLLARGLQRRSDAAWHVALLLVVAGIFLLLFKGLEYEEASLLTIVLLLLIPCRGHFYRKASFFSERFTSGWIAAIVIVLVTSIWLGLLSYKKVDFTEDLWWRFTLHGDAPRYLRATLGALVVASSFAVARLLRPAAPDPKPPTPEELDAVVPIVRASPRTHAWLALLGDKSLLYDERRTAFIMYGIEGRSWIALGDPVGPSDACADLIWDFRELCDRHGGWSVFYQIDAANLPLYLDLGLTPLKLGEEACVPLQSFTLEGGRRQDLRTALHRIEREGGTFEIVPAEATAPLLPELRRLSDGWLASRNSREKRFSIGFFNEEYLRRFPIATVRVGGRLVAFANLWLGGGGQELSLDLMRHAEDAPPGVMDYLFVRILLWGREQGFQTFNLGMAPLSGLENRALSSLWNRVGSVIFRHGEHFYNFQGLRAFKEKFDPVWRPKYLVSPAGLALPNILLNVAAIIAGGVPAVLRK